MGLVPDADRWATQVQEAFGFLEAHGFKVIDGDTYRLGDWTLLGNGCFGIHLDSDGDTRTLEVTLIRLTDNQLPARWWERQSPRVRIGLQEVAERLQPQSLIGESDLPRIEREADRASHLQFWASVLRALAADWPPGMPICFDDIECRVRGEVLDP